MKSGNRYEQIIEAIFRAHFHKGITEFEFSRAEIESFAAKLEIKLPKNLGDLIYTFRYRTSYPESIMRATPKGMNWLILPAGRARYRFALSKVIDLKPNLALAVTKIPDATPGVISMYSLSDEQALLAKLRYNRLIDIFTRLACYPLQSHLRTSVPEMGQVETDDLYVGVDRRGAHYILPVQAKGGRDKLSVVQVQQDLAMCAHKFPNLICRAIAAQFLDSSTIALFEFEESTEGIRVTTERHYRLVLPTDLTSADMENYRNSLGD